MLNQPTLTFDATRKVRIKTPKTVKGRDKEGSPRTIDITNFNVALEDVVGNAGTVGLHPDNSGDFQFDPGNEVETQASGTLVYSGDADGFVLTFSNQPFELEAGAPTSVDEVVVAIEVEPE